MKRWMRRKLIGVAAAVGALVSLLLPGVAQAAYWGNELNYAEVILDTPDAYGHPYVCASVTGAKVCFMPYGEIFFVKDTVADGHSAGVDWVYDGDGTRTGTCVSQHGAGTWAMCNKSFSELGGVDFRAVVYEAGNPVREGTWHYSSTS
jgi:hypothetical protein